MIIFLGLGEVYTWGDNDEGQLGDGTTNAIQRPRLVAALQGKKINRVACGSAHTLAWSTSKPANAGKLPTQVIFLACCIQVLNICISFLDLCINSVYFGLSFNLSQLHCFTSVFQRIPVFCGKKASSFS